MNNTRINASKVYREQLEKKNEQINSKKVMLDKQKDIKTKYTMVKKV